MNNPFARNKRITIKQVIAAAKENGYEHTVSGWFNESGASPLKPITKACIMGQAALNLGVNHHELRAAIDSIDKNRYTPLASRIIRKNDDYVPTPGGGYRPTTYEEMVKYLTDTLKPYEDQVIVVPKKKYYARKTRRP
jgi:hypothetical protein